MHMNTPQLTEAHVGLGALQSAHWRFSVLHIAQAPNLYERNSRDSIPLNHLEVVSG